MVSSHKLNIAILGASGYIGKSILLEFLKSEKNNNLHLFSRDVTKLTTILETLFPNFGTTNIKCSQLSDFDTFSYDVIINVTGVGDTRLLREDPANIFYITESIDSLIVEHLKKYPETIYINLSSGAVYGDNFHAPISEETKATFSINKFKVSEYYSIAKLHAEAKHRSLSNFKIIDLRVFAFFSRFVDTQAEFLMSEIVDCLLSGKVFKTNDVDIVRDYISPVDLFQLIECVIQKPENCALDVYSKSPVHKFELLSELQKTFDLKYEITNDQIRGGDKFSKRIYYSTHHVASQIGYAPRHTSTQGICNELSALVIK